MKINYCIGAKYQYFDDDNKLHCPRLIKVKEDNTKFVFKEPDMEKYSVDKDTFLSYTKLEPDVLVNILLIKHDEISDVYLFIQKIGDILPCVILRQNALSELAVFGDVSIGLCVSNNIHISNTENLSNYMDFGIDDIVDKYTVYAYMEDSYEDIIESIGTFNKKINSTLADIKSYYDDQEVKTGIDIKGCAKDLKELMERTNFSYYFRDAFNIITIDFPIVLEDNCTEDGVVTLNNKQIERLEFDVLGAYVTNIGVLKYDRDIDVSKIVSKSHIVVYDTNKEIFLISYDFIKLIKPDNVDDIMSVMPGAEKLYN